MVFSKKIFLTFFLLLIFSNCAFSQQIFVSLNPVNQTGLVEIYESEVVEFELVIVNNESLELKNFNAVVSVGSELSLIVNGKERKEQKVTIVTLPPSSAKKKTVLVKGIAFSTKDLSLNVKYGFGEELIHSYSTNLKVAKNPLQVNARLEKTALEPLEENKLLLDLTNTSEAEIRNLSAVLSVPSGFVDKSRPMEFAVFAQNQSLSNSPFAFKAPSESVGEKIVLLSIQYEDAKGIHQIQKNFVVDVRERNQFLYLLFGTALILALFAIYLKVRKKTPVQENQQSESEENTS